jgi:hypothetical protein
MRRRDVGLGIAIGLGILGFILVGGSATSHPVGNFVEKSLFASWFVGVALLVAAVALHALGRWRTVERVLGLIGLSWVAFVVSYDLLLLLIVLYALMFRGGFGY